jgi:hypothetical protein
VCRFPPNTGEEDVGWWCNDPVREEAGHLSEVDFFEAWGYFPAYTTGWKTNELGVVEVGPKHVEGKKVGFTVDPSEAFHRYTTVFYPDGTFSEYIDGVLQSWCNKVAGELDPLAYSTMRLGHMLRTPEGHVSGFTSGSRKFTIRSVAIYQDAPHSGVNVINGGLAPGTLVAGAEEKVHPLNGILQFKGTLPKVFNITKRLNGTLRFAGALPRRLQRALTATLRLTGSLPQTIRHAFVAKLFPSVSETISDTFERATEDPLSNGGKWSKLDWAWSIGRVYSAFYGFVPTLGGTEVEEAKASGAYWNGAELANPTVSVHMFGEASRKDYVALWACTTGAETKNGYRVKFTGTGAGGIFIVSLEKWVGGVETRLGEATVTLAISGTNTIRLVVEGGKAKALFGKTE